MIDCPDKTDEIDCKMIITDESYLREVPPNTNDKTTEDNAAAKEKLKVEIKVTVLEILEISEVDYRFSVQYSLELLWYDPALLFANLKEEANLNGLTFDTFSDIWLPKITFENTANKDVSEHDLRAFGFVTREGNRTKSKSNQLRNTHFFQGANNRISMRRIYSTEFNCLFTLRYHHLEVREQI